MHKMMHRAALLRSAPSGRMISRRPLSWSTKVMSSSTGCNRRLGPSKCSVNLGGGGLRRCAGLRRWGCCGCGRGITLAARSSELRGLEYCCSRVGLHFCQPVNILSSALSCWDHTQLSVGGASRVSVGCRSEEVALFAIRRSWSVVYECRWVGEKGFIYSPPRHCRPCDDIVPVARLGR
jgi:hypothetical protein